jgi:hypothetical protein
LNATESAQNAGEEHRWTKVLVMLALTFVAGLVGFILLPSAPLTQGIKQPTILIAANQPGVTIMVDMGARPGPQAMFGLTIKVVSPVTRPITFEVRVDNLPALEASDPPARLAFNPNAPGLPLVRRQDGYAYVQQLTIEPSSALARSHSLQRDGIVLTTLRPIVDAQAGPDLQIRFPLVATEQTASQLVAPSTQATSGFPFLMRAPVYFPTIKLGTCEFSLGDDASPFYSSARDLTNYQTLAGDPPTLTTLPPSPGEVINGQVWSWTGLSAPTLLAQNVIEADQAQQGLFWSGTALGVCAASAIGCVLEMTSVLLAVGARRRATTAVAEGPAAEAAESASAARETGGTESPSADGENAGAPPDPLPEG